MQYLDQTQLDDALAGNPRYRDFIEQIRHEVDGFFKTFRDSPEYTSRWGHHYFCKEEGGLLIYDPTMPETHTCSICGKSYTDELLNGVWHTMYRNQGAINAWKSALAYRALGNRRYLDYVLEFVDFYNDNYLKFTLHNKEGLEFDTVDDALWGTSRIMPQALNESIFLVRLVNALELIRDDLPEGYRRKLQDGMFGEAFRMFRPQVNAIHNIPTWLNCGIGIMGLFLGNQEMVDFAFDAEFGLVNQLQKGLTDDYFWYEGSIHYNNFLLEGVVNALLFSELNGRDFSIGKEAVARMIDATYLYAFDNHRLPNPNDGWPDVNLKTYSYLYSVAVKVLGEDSKTGRLLGSILNHDGERGSIPLSRPYYYMNDISLEELLFVPGLRERHRDIISCGSVLFPDSYCGMLRKSDVNVFLKYGHNGPSHAHPDKMSIEVMFRNSVFSRDLSNAGYGNRLCNEWHRVSASHNTVVVDGECHSGFGGGVCLMETDTRMSARADEVYSGVSFCRDIEIDDSGFLDSFQVESSDDVTADYFFHVDGILLSEPVSETSEIGYSKNGYQHLKSIRKVLKNTDSIELEWQVGSMKVKSTIGITGAELFLMESPDNPVVHYRPGFIIRRRGRVSRFDVSWSLAGDF